jgi:hypothetical protein
MKVMKQVGSGESKWAQGEEERRNIDSQTLARRLKFNSGRKVQ